MQNSQAHKYHQTIIERIYAKDLSGALDKIEKSLEKMADDSLKLQFNTIRSNYQLILQYLVEGTKDQERPELYKRAARQMLDLADRILSIESTREPSDPISVHRKTWIDSPENNSRKLLELMLQLIAEYRLHESLSDNESDTDFSTALRRDNSLSHIFKLCWLSPELDEDIIAGIRNLIAPGAIDEQEQAVIVSGLNLGVLLNFNSSRISLLLELARHPQAAIRVRALTGSIQAVYRYHLRFEYYPELKKAMKKLFSDDISKDELEILLFQLIRSQDTDAITKKLREEIIPEMIKITPRVTEKLDRDEFSMEDIGSEENPDWANFFDDSPELLDKLQEFNEMQMDGSDVFMSAFANLKNFPFFQETHHWFTPYSPNNKFVVNEMHRMQDRMDTSKFVNSLAASNFLCNSDKYSFLFNISNLPDQQLGILNKYFAAEMEMMREVQAEDQLLDALAVFKSEARIYLQDLYRFHKLHYLSKIIPDIFSSHLKLHELSVLGTCLEERGLLRSIAEFHFTRAHYEQSAGLFAHLAKLGDTSYEVFEKAGFSFQKVGHFENALSFYTKAELFDTNQEWLLKKMAYCHRQLNRPVEAIPFYKAALKKSPDNQSLMIQLANTLLEAEKYNEALNQYYGVELKFPENQRIIRPIAWCLLNTGKPKKALDYMLRLEGSMQDWQDQMNLAHAYWISGDAKMAFRCYTTSLYSIADKAVFIRSFDQDTKLLRRQAISDEEIAMMKDAIRTDWFNKKTA